MSIIMIESRTKYLMRTRNENYGMNVNYQEKGKMKWSKIMLKKME